MLTRYLNSCIHQFENALSLSLSSLSFKHVLFFFFKHDFSLSISSMAYFHLLRLWLGFCSPHHSSFVFLLSACLLLCVFNACLFTFVRYDNCMYTCLSVQLTSPCPLWTMLIYQVVFYSASTSVMVLPARQYNTKKEDNSNPNAKPVKRNKTITMYIATATEPTQCL